MISRSQQKEDLGKCSISTAGLEWRKDTLDFSLNQCFGCKHGFLSMQTSERKAAYVWKSLLSSAAYDGKSLSGHHLKRASFHLSEINRVT